MNKILIAGSIAVAALATGLVMAHAPKLIKGQEAGLFGAKISTWAKLDASGKVLEAGFTLPYSTVLQTPNQMDMNAPMKADAVLEFPAQVRKTTFLNHLGLFWNPMGHPPMERYGAPHFDFHFFTITPAQAAAINCSDLRQGNPKQIAQGWLPPLPPNAPAKEFCVPLMGFHSGPLSEFKAPGQFKDGRFDKVMLGGYYQGKFNFLEPMITRALLLKKQSFSLPIPRPASIGINTLYPTKFEARYDAAAKMYNFVFSGFEPVL